MAEDPAGTSRPSRLRRYGWWILGAVVLVVLNLLVVGAMVTAVLGDNDLRRTGPRIEATVVENDDDGYPMVRFDIEGQGSTAEIDATGARPSITHVGQHVLVVVGGEGGYAVPAVVDSSALWIENLAIAAAICLFLDVVALGVVGVAFAVRGVRRGPRIDTIEFSAPGPTALPTVSIPLRSWRPRRSSLEIGPNRLLAHLPAWFGDVPLVVPLMDLSIANPAEDVEATDHTGVPQREPLVPLLRTVANFDAPDLTLLFAHPVRVPPLRLLQMGNPHLSVRRSRNEPGLFIDGLNLTVGDRGGAVAALRQRGIPVVDPDRWAIETFGELTDPETLAARRADTRRAGRLNGVQGLATGGAVVAAVWSTVGEDVDPVPVAVAVGLAAIAGVAHIAGRRLPPRGRSA